ALIANGLTQTLPQKFCYDGPMFRYERPQKGRYRQLHQAGLEYIGAQSPYADIEIISFGYAFLKKLGLGEVTLHINTLGDTQSRLAYRKALVDYFTPMLEQLSQDSQFRLEHNPLRILDSKDAEDKKLCEHAPKYQNYLNQESKDFFNVVLKGLDQLNIPYTIERSLVRGLDYYCHTAFEFKTSALGAQDAVMAGGRYDHLVEQMGGPSIPAVGLGMGVDRLCLLLEETNPNTLPKQPAIIGIIPAGENEFPQALALAHQLRNANIPIEFPLSGNMGKRFKQLDKAGCSHAVVLGSDELAQNKVTVKNLRIGQESEKQIDIPLDDLSDYLQTICG
ncbi:MAG: histidine--tRNA ligase, partial [Alphaproteobacteria bacterium]|nr:histidine--tRNA ligase [Alphaproteobacteria bacterium]